MSKKEEKDPDLRAAAKDAILTAIAERVTGLGTEQNILLLAQAYQSLAQGEYTETMREVDSKKK